MKAYNFINVSIRGRVGFSILCLENSISFFELPNLDWSLILKLLWSYTDSNVGLWHEKLS